VIRAVSSGRRHCCHPLDGLVTHFRRRFNHLVAVFPEGGAESTGSRPDKISGRNGRVTEQYLTNGLPDISKIKPIIFTMHDNNYWQVGGHLGGAWNIGKDYKK
jgi:hypothetical protein